MGKIAKAIALDFESRFIKAWKSTLVALALGALELALQTLQDAPQFPAWAHGLICAAAALLALYKGKATTPSVVVPLLLFCVLTVGSSCASFLHWKSPALEEIDRCLAPGLQSQLGTGVLVGKAVLDKDGTAGSLACSLATVIGIDLAKCVWTEIARSDPDPVLAAKAGALLNGQCPAE
jgi:hypothetical protein